MSCHVAPSLDKLSQLHNKDLLEHNDEVGGIRDCSFYTLKVIMHLNVLFEQLYYTQKCFYMQLHRYSNIFLIVLVGSHFHSFTITFPSLQVGDKIKPTSGIRKSMEKKHKMYDPTS